MTTESIIMLVIGATIGFIASIAKDWLVEYRKDKAKKKQFKREKLEEIFILLYKFNQNIMMLNHTYDYNDEARLAMIIRFYLHDAFSTDWSIFVRACLEVNNIKLAGQNHVDIYIYMEKCSKKYSNLCNMIVSESKKYY